MEEKKWKDRKKNSDQAKVLNREKGREGMPYLISFKVGKKCPEANQASKLCHRNVQKFPKMSWGTLYNKLTQAW